MNHFIVNYKTSLLGLAASGFNLAANGTDWKQVALSVVLGLLGLFAKDGNVTGGTIHQ